MTDFSEKPRRSLQPVAPNKRLPRQHCSAGSDRFDSFYGPQHAGPTRSDWLALVANIVAVVVGASLLLTADNEAQRNTGIVGLALFGSGVPVLASVILRKRRIQRFSADNIEVVGGVPIRQSVTVLLLIAVWLLVLGGILLWFSSQLPLEGRLAFGSLVVIGAGMLIAIASGKWPGDFLQFDPEGLTVGKRSHRTLIPWDAIASVRGGDDGDNPSLLIEVGDPAMLHTTPAEAQWRVMREIAKTRIGGADFSIATTPYMIDLPVLGGAVVRYVRDPSARSGLRQRSISPL